MSTERPSGRFNRNTLQGVLDVAYHPEYLRPAHRLDANTTGLVVLARKHAYAKVLQRQFTEGSVMKTYLARVVGHPEWDTMQCEFAIRSEPIHGGSRAIDEHGQPAMTRFRVTERCSNGESILEAMPITGRTHQIRIHLAALGFPICNDPLYLVGGQSREQADDALQLLAMGLHAWKIEFSHPISNAPVHFEAASPL